MFSQGSDAKQGADLQLMVEASSKQDDPLGNLRSVSV
jgi:hypothetical protein